MNLLPKDLQELITICDQGLLYQGAYNSLGESISKALYEFGFRKLSAHFASNAHIDAWVGDRVPIQPCPHCVELVRPKTNAVAACYGPVNEMERILLS